MSDIEDRYIEVDIPNTDLSVIVKLDNEGIVVDVWNDTIDEGAKLVSTGYRFYEEMGLEMKVKEEE